MADGWPAQLRHGGVGLRPLRRSDATRIATLRKQNADWLRRWDATLPPGEQLAALTPKAMISVLRRRAREGHMMPFVITFAGRVVGQLTVNTIQRGSAMSASLGYWISEDHAGQGITPTAVAMATDHLLTTGRLHRIEIAIRPENASSLRVVEKLGFQEVGYAPRYLHIDGDWRDHRLFQITAEDIPGGMIARLDQAGPTAP